MWDVSPAEAVALQRSLREQVRYDHPLPLEAVRTVAGVDVSSSRFDPLLTAGIVVWDRVEHRVVETAYAQMDAPFPYIPGLLSFREIPALLEAAKGLRTTPDLWMVDGQGIAHPRRLGIATHWGLERDEPSVGVAKSILTGTHVPLPDAPGATVPLLDGDEQIGTVYRSKVQCRPLIVSPGHMVDHPSALALVAACLRGYRLPEPTRLAHLFVNAVRTRSDLSLFAA